MLNAGAVLDVRSLASARPGEWLEIRCILFDGVRALCDTLGLRQGDTVHVAVTTPGRIGLTRADGMGTLLDLRWAEFIQVAVRPAEVYLA